MVLRPLRTLSTAERNKLRQVVDECDETRTNYMGINLSDSLKTADEFYKQFFAENGTEETYQQINAPPLILLQF